MILCTICRYFPIGSIIWWHDNASYFQKHWYSRCLTKNFKSTSKYWVNSIIPDISIADDSKNLWSVHYKILMSCFDVSSQMCDTVICQWNVLMSLYMLYLVCANIFWCFIVCFVVIISNLDMVASKSWGFEFICYFSTIDYHLLWSRLAP